MSAEVAPSPTEASGGWLLRARDLVAGYGKVPLLPALDVTLEPGQMWCLFGRNGAGKTTLMRTLLGLLPAVSGLLERRAAVRVGYVPQRAELDLSVPSRVIDVVRTGLDEGWSFLRPFPTSAQKQALLEALRRARVEDLVGRPFRELSEGQKQRALLARALVTSPGLVVLDEPTSAMDHENEAMVFELLSGLRQRGAGVLLITHDVERAANLATHAIFVDKDTDVAVAGPIDEVFHEKAFIRQYGAVFALTTEREQARSGRALDAEEHF